ncbi:PREDICTED: uncharacterized protein LOC108554137 [Eufriesea mexicana]|uniref:uncharacterized protein LOC108554137 n=1 Tax=Eufriesea mexicana TaxID=516756 RepID=UPI00083C3432|nr:PREDICTED: uncharacterized protein LOC108554137 [Eufriesea mexicana]XP_017764800.1 PREDICTED: uncharacterized protein LOC108554137 [Eufriesea mexicana]
MTGRSSTKRTGLCLLALLLSCLSSDVFVVGEPEPLPSELLYNKNFLNAENLILLNKLKQVIEEKEDMAEREKSLDNMQMMIQSVLESRAKIQTGVQPDDYSGEELPTPNAVVSQMQRSGKRTAAISYVTLCHIKICNMGRKRQLHK